MPRDQPLAASLQGQIKRNYGAQRPRKSRLAEMGRASGVRGILVYCSDYKCSHSTAISADSGRTTCGSPISSCDLSAVSAEGVAPISAGDLRSPTSALPLHQGPSVTLGFFQRLEHLSTDSESVIGNRSNIISVDTSRNVLAVILIIHLTKLLNSNPFDQGGTVCRIIPVHGSLPSIGSRSSHHHRKSAVSFSHRRSFDLGQHLTRTSGTKQRAHAETQSADLFQSVLTLLARWHVANCRHQMRSQFFQFVHRAAPAPRRI